jgi:hypothetical protein
MRSLRSLWFIPLPGRPEAIEIPLAIGLLGNHERDKRPFAVLNGIDTVVEREERNVCQPLTHLWLLRSGRLRLRCRSAATSEQ